MTESSWNITKQNSRYHFDPTILDDRWDTVIKLGKFHGDWSSEINQMLNQSRPITWRSRGAPGLGPRRNPVEFEQEEYDLATQGYGKHHIITNINYNLPPIAQKMADYFGLDKMLARLHVQKPGQVWNLHIDKLQDWNPEDPSKVTRIMIQLTPWEQGHFMSFGNYNYAQWEVGDILTFDWVNVPHSTANAGHSSRITFQLTGIKTAKTEEFLEQLKQGPVLV
jgi:hypothetical protein